MQSSRRSFLILASGVPLGVLGSVEATTSDVPFTRMPSIDEFIKAEMRRQKVPGLALAIVSHGTTVASKGYGLADVELGVPVREETVFQSGSIGKQFTAVCVMLQVEDGKLALDDPLTKYFSDAPAAWKEITVRNLLTHTSGIPDYTDEQVQLDGRPVLDYRRDYSEEELLKIAYGLPLDFPPGARWKYSNTGYAVLGILVHKVSGRFYGDVLRDRVFVPLQMGTARIISEADIIPNRASGYRLLNGELKNQEWVSPSLNTTADGALYLSIRDYIAWDRGLRAQAILNKHSWAEVYRPVSLKDRTLHAYGFGWGVEQWRERPWYHHSGEWQGFKAEFSRYLADDLTIVVLANLAESSPAQFVDGIAALLDSSLPKLADSRSGV